MSIPVYSLVVVSSLLWLAHIHSETLIETTFKINLRLLVIRPFEEGLGFLFTKATWSVPAKEKCRQDGQLSHLLPAPRYCLLERLYWCTYGL